MIGKLLGHTQVQTTARYAHLARDSIQNAAARITGSIGWNLAPDGQHAPPDARDRPLRPSSPPSLRAPATAWGFGSNPVRVGAPPHREPIQAATVRHGALHTSTIIELRRIDPTLDLLE